MECKVCGSKWNAPNSRLSSCPFCGADLIMFKKRADISFVQAMAQIISMPCFSQRTIVDNPKMILSAFRDIAPELKKEARLLDMLLSFKKMSIVLDADKMDKAEQEHIVLILSDYLQSEFYIDKSAASSFCASYLDALLSTSCNEDHDENSNAKFTCTSQKRKSMCNDSFIDECFNVFNAKLVRYIAPWSPELKTVRIPDAVVEIGAKAFAGRDDVQKIILPCSLVKIDELAFEDCSNLRAVYVPESLQQVAENIFGNDVGWVPEIFSSEDGKALPDWPDEWLPKPFDIGADTDHTFADQTTTLPSLLAGDYDRSDFLYSADNPGVLLKYLGNQAVVTVPSGTTEIAAKAFQKTKFLTKVILPDGLKAIGRRAFALCKKLEEINLPDGLTFIGDNAFYGCSGLLKEDTGLQMIVIPGSVKVIPSFCFGGCYNLKSVIIKPGVELIESYAFCGATIENLALSDSVRIIKDNAFPKNNYPKNVRRLPQNIMMGETEVERFFYSRLVK